MIPFKPTGYSKEEMISIIESIYHVSPSNMEKQAIEDFFTNNTGRKYAIAVRDPIIPLLAVLKNFSDSHRKILLSPLSYYKHLSPYLKLIESNIYFADVERWFLNIDVKRLSNVPINDINVVIINNSLGNPADWDFVSELFKNNNILKIEDSRETLFTEYKGRQVGSFGDLSIISFSENSILRGYGGVFLTDDKKIHNIIKENAEPIDNIMSSLLLAQIKHIESRSKIRSDLAKLYSDNLINIEGIKPQFPPNYVTNMCWSYFSVHFGKRYTKDAINLIKELMVDDGIEVVEYPISQDIKENNPQQYLHIAHEVSTRAILLPFYESLMEEDIYFICERLKEHTIQIGAGSKDH